MGGNSFGKIFTLTTFGESHGRAIGGIVDGCPAGLKFDIEFINKELSRRKPGQSNIVTQRNESDEVSFLSGLADGYTTGAPLAFMIENLDVKKKDYAHLADTFRPSHADYAYHKKYGIRDKFGGGRSSARETACRVVAGAIAKLILSEVNVSIYAYTSQVGPIKLDKSFEDLDLSLSEKSLVRCPDENVSNEMIEYIELIRKEGDSIGGVITCIIQGVPAGLGEPVFDKLQADLAKAMLSINAAKGFELGIGLKGVTQKGSEQNDLFYSNGKTISTRSNHSGGIQGGISNGQPIYFNTLFKPVSTILKNQESVNELLENVVLEGKGRHDPCVLPRAVPIVEAMSALVLVDHYFRNKLVRL